MKKIIFLTIALATFTNAYCQEHQGKFDQLSVNNQEIQDPYMDPPFTIEEPVEENQERNWNVSVGAFAATRPEYKGSGKNEFKVIPFVVGDYRIDKKQRIFLSFEPGAGGEYGGLVYGYAPNQDWEFGFGMGYREGRDSKDAAILTGLEDIDDTLTLMALAKYNYEDFNFRIRFSKGLKSSNDGITTKLSAGYKHEINSQWTIRAGLSTTFGSSDYMDQNFSTTESMMYGRREFKANAGFRDISFAIGANYNIKGPHNIILGGKVTNFLGEAKKSPVSEDTLNFSAAAGYRYKF